MATPLAAVPAAPNVVPLPVPAVRPLALPARRPRPRVRKVRRTTRAAPTAPVTSLDVLRRRQLYAAVITLALLACVTTLLLTHAIEDPQTQGVLVGLFAVVLAWWAKSPAQS